MRKDVEQHRQEQFRLEEHRQKIDQNGVAIERRTRVTEKSGVAWE